MGTERRVILYSGRVQGVGFRWQTCAALMDLPVSGYVRNLSDGRVELVVEGPTEATAKVLRRVRSRLGDHIASHEESTIAATGEFEGFGVRR